MKKVAIYARYSSDLQNARSIDDQIRICRERSEREGWTIHECYTDYMLSGAIIVRPSTQTICTIAGWESGGAPEGARRVALTVGAANERE